MRVYLDNNLVTYSLNAAQGKRANSQVLQYEIDCLAVLGQMPEIEMLVSEEALAEIEVLQPTSLKRKELEQMYFALKRASVIRNSAVYWDDPIAAWDSPDALWNHPYTNKHLDAVKGFLQSEIHPKTDSKRRAIEFDARYIANAMLPQNQIDVFLTADQKSIWKYRDEIKARFGVEVRLPCELLKELRSRGH